MHPTLQLVILTTVMVIFPTVITKNEKSCISHFLRGVGRGKGGGGGARGGAFLHTIAYKRVYLKFGIVINSMIFSCQSQYSRPRAQEKKFIVLQTSGENIHSIPTMLL